MFHLTGIRDRFIQPIVPVLHVNDIKGAVWERFAVRTDQGYCKIEKSDFLKICQNKGFGELDLRKQVSGRLDFYLFSSEYFRILPFAAVKINAKIGTFPEAPAQISKAS